MKKLLLLLSMVMVFSLNAMTLPITGSVYDETGNPLPGVTIVEKGTTNGAQTDKSGKYSIQVNDTNSTLVFSFVGFQTEEIRVGKKQQINVILYADVQQLQEVVLQDASSSSLRKRLNATGAVSRAAGPSYMVGESNPFHNTESYDAIEENIFHKSADKPLSTFSIDVDAASYSNMRRFLHMGQLPPKDAVRIEEMINYFHYDYDGPKDDKPFAIHTAKTKAPWNEDHLLVKIGIQGKKLAMEQLPPSNIVFLLDVSGSMNAPNKLPLLISSLKMLTNELRPQDQVAIVVYAGAAGLVLPPTDGANKSAIIEALENLEAGGSTAGGAGIKLAYKVAKEHFVEGGNNRVILATDGDFNIGASSNGEMQRLIEEKREEGVFLTVLGFGMGNYKDSKMETLADKGNGNYAYIDNILEAKKVLVTEFGGTLFTIAKDVKIQVEFNPNVVQAYRLIGYENRKLNDEDFNDDKKDAGELGSGHTVTALYEIIPVGVKSNFTKEVDDLKYQSQTITGDTDELLTVKFRYKEPDENTSQLIEQPLANDSLFDEDENLNWAATVASFGMVLRDSEFKGNLTFSKILTMAHQSAGVDEFGYRAEFIKLVNIANRIQ
ncbi:vWA domain-containing protein [Marinoscillum luteum]|uniref:von Willebrand factor type A domain-containing protein n=1 Tax=Marinoscillum luteum TaxID=861051 RepID=A0ABW7NC64_9BACT